MGAWRGGPTTPASPAVIVALACLGAATVTSGVQGIAPAIPAMQAEFSLTDAQISLITSVYLLPSIFSAFIGGLLADRLGARPVFAVSLLLFGAGGLVLLVAHPFWLLLAVRFAQGAAFGVVVALSVSIIGGVAAAGPAAARGQSRRTIAMALSQAVFPVACGLLLAISWYAPFAIQVIAIPLSLAVWLLLPPITHQRKASVRGASREALKAPAIVGVQILGALRFFFAFAVVTYFPVLAVAEVGLTAAVVGLVLGASNLLAAASAATSARLARRWTSVQLIGGCLAVITVCLLGVALSVNPVIVIAALLLFGLQDGVYGVAHNVLVTETAPPAVRSTYVGVTGAIRNIGKFAAPLVFGASTLVLSLSNSFLALAGVGLASLTTARSVASTLKRRRPGA
jgi:MFS family permease